MYACDYAPPLVVDIHAIKKGERDAQHFRPIDGSRYGLILKVLKFCDVWQQKQISVFKKNWLRLFLKKQNLNKVAVMNTI